MLTSEISIVIICKNAAATISKAIATSSALSNDVIVVESGSTDGTIELIRQTSARLFEIEWEGYGQAKNFGNAQAKYNWILSLDADEYLDDTLISLLRHVALDDVATVYSFQRINYLGNKPIYHGEWGKDFVTRVFNRLNAKWDILPVHEKIIYIKSSSLKRLQGSIHHYTSPDINTFNKKLEKYARLMADKYYMANKSVAGYKKYFSYAVSFLQNYIFKSGFLDGKEGLQIALANAIYSYKKYKYLQELKDRNKPKVNSG